MDSIVLSLGTNVGDRHSNLKLASEALENNGVKIVKASKVYETEPRGYKKQDYFLNRVVLVETSKTPQELLSCCKKIEQLMGRTPSFPDGPRLIDIDILFYNDLFISSDDLMIPHPRFQDRRFVLVPLTEIASTQKHPMMGASMAELLDECEDESIVKFYR